MNKQFIITNFAAFALMLFLPTGCRQADGKQDAVQSYRVIKVAASPVEISESYSAAIRGRQDVDILPQISGRIIRLKVKEGERVKTGQVLAVIDQVPYRAALRTAQANVSAAQAKVETARIELRGKQALFDEKVISDYELSLARNQLAVACAELEQAKAQESDARNNLSLYGNQKPEQRSSRHIALSHRCACRSQYGTAFHGRVRQCGDVCLFLHFGEYATAIFGSLWLD